MVWAYSKGAVACPDNQTAQNRTPDQIIRILRNAMSDGDRKEFPKNIMRYCAKKMNEWISNDDVLRGTIDDPKNLLQGFPLKKGARRSGENHFDRMDLDSWNEKAGINSENMYEPMPDPPAQLTVPATNLAAGGGGGQAPSAAQTTTNK